MQRIFSKVSLMLLILSGINCSGNLINNYKIGDPIDAFNGVQVYYNGDIDNNSGRNITKDNYNLGIKYQCVEFVKRYYFEYLHHTMPDPFGHAKDFFDKDIPDGAKNKKRNLVQYKNGSKSKPMVSDLLVFDGWSFNKFGHVAIISKVGENSIEIIQQNPGKMRSTRESYDLFFSNGIWHIEHDRILGWLRKE